MQNTHDAMTRSRLWRLFAVLLARPAWPAALLVVFTVLMGWQATNIQVAVNLSGLIGPQTQSARAMRIYETRFEPIRAEEVLLVTAPSFADEQALSDLEDLVLELQFVDGVAQVLSLAALPAPGRDGAWLSGPELADLAPRERLETMRRISPLAEQMISADLTQAVVVVIPAEGAGGDDLIRAINEATALIDGLTVENVGIAAVQRAIAAELLRDLRVISPAAIILCLGLSMLMFRSWRAVVVIALPPIVGLVWFMGWLGYTGTAIDPLMGALPVLLIVLAFSDSIHVYHAAMHRVYEGGPYRPAVITALAETAPAAAMTSVTTAIAFASLSLTESPSLNTMSSVGMVGMVLSLAAVLLLTPILMWALNMPRAGVPPPRIFEIVVPPALAVAKLGRVVPVLTLLVFVGVAALQSQSTIGFRYADYLPRGADVSLALAQMETSGLGSDRMLVIVEADPDAPLDRVRHAIAAIWGAERTAWTAGASGEAMLARMASVDGSAHALPIQLAIAARDIRADTALAALRSKLAEAGLGQVTQVIGPGYALLVEGPALVQSLRLGLYGTIAVITIMVGFVFRSWRLAAIALVVNLIPILGVESWLVLIGRELTIMNVIALTIAFGIAVDDTLHFLNRLRLAPAGSDPALHAITEAGPPMAAATMILLGGLVLTLTSALPGMAIYGGLLALAVTFALAADLFLLPGLIRWSTK